MPKYARPPSDGGPAVHCCRRLGGQCAARCRAGGKHRGSACSHMLLSACSLPGLCRGLPRLPLTGATVSSSSASGTLSCTFAPVSTKASGRPCRSVSRWRFVPALPRSVGLGPVAAPPFLPRWTRCPYTLGSSRCGLPSANAAATLGAVAAIARLVASRAAASNTSRPSRTSSPAAASPTGYPSAAKKRMPMSAARSDTRGRPPLGLSGSAGSSGWTIDQRSSLTSAFVMLFS